MPALSAIKQIVSYSKKGLLDGIYKAKPRNFIPMRTVSIPEPVVRLPLTCFSRTKGGDVVLYRGLHIDGLTEQNVHYGKSVAASIGQSVQEVLAGVGKRTKKNIRSLANCFSGLTQGNDPILHTTTKRAVARRFAKNGGILVEYHIPKKFLKERGMVGHLGEDEIDFFYSIPKKYVAKVTKVKPTVAKPPIQEGMIPPPPAFISIA